MHLSAVTRERATEALVEARDRIRGLSEEKLGRLEWHRDYVTPLTNELLETEPFAPLKGKLINLPDGAGMGAVVRVGTWAIERLEAGCTPDDILRSITAELQENVTHALEVWAVFGADVEKAIQLGQRGRILPSAQVEEAWQAHGVQKSLSPSIFEQGDCCVLLQEVTVVPAISPEHPSAERQTETNPNLDDRLHTAELVRAAFLLNGSTAVEVSTRTSLPVGDRFLSGWPGMRMGSFSRGNPIHTAMFKADEVFETYEALASFANSESLLRGIDRLARSRSNVFPDDKALDLGIGAEILLMHGGDQSNAEITNKLALRSAWLLGKTADERLEISRSARALYKARSKVAHSGRLADPAKFDAAGAEELVGDLARKILRNGEFPDWEKLCVGG